MLQSLEPADQVDRELRLNRPLPKVTLVCVRLSEAARPWRIRQLRTRRFALRRGVEWRESHRVVGSTLKWLRRISVLMTL
ncbi:MAG: hypothetical protein KIT82_14700 [Bradyrhizobium sp.]|nr:hypothetical protein [Bradyrhizobium sp.]